MRLLLDLALVAGFAVLAVLVARMSQLQRKSSELLRRVYEQSHFGHHPHGRGDDEPSHAMASIGISPGYRLPTAFSDVHKGGAWTVVVVVNGTDHPRLGEVSGHVAPALDQRYAISALVAETRAEAPASSDGFNVVLAPTGVLPPLSRPAVVLLDPDGIVQGVGAPLTASDILAFVVEGEQRGFGPEEDARRAALR